MKSEEFLDWVMLAAWAGIMFAGLIALIGSVVVALLNAIL
jgi:hypothetical protein